MKRQLNCSLRRAAIACTTIASLTAALALAGCATQNQPKPVAQGIYSPGETNSILWPGLDHYKFPITTSSAGTQRWFNQGYQWMLGFNHDEAIRSFKEASARDPEAPMPYWGIAMSYGMNINDRFMTPEKYTAASEAAALARTYAHNGNALEQALITAMSARYTMPPPEDQFTYDQAYANAMAEVHDRFPRHSDVGVLYAESLMNLQPWDYWTNHREPKGNNTTFIPVLESIIQRDPMHQGACHLYIHAMEAGPDPAKAEASADNLLHRIPGAGHLVHMPSHLYARVGRYGDAADSNTLAIAADRAYFEQGTEQGMYYIYYAHNLHFLAFASMMEGQYEPAIEAARDLETAIPEPALRQFAGLIEGITPSTYHVNIRFGKWNEILEQELPADYRLVSRAVHYYARGIALSALGRTEEAHAEVAKFNAAAEAIPGEWFIFNNQVSTVLPIAHAMLEGELAYREGDLDKAWAALRRGIEAEDKLIYDEPPAWMIPVRHAMGALMMASGEYEEAEKLYREDQIIHPGNGWSLLGLQQSLAAQGKTDEAETLTAAIDKAWKRLAVRPTSSCFCEPGN